MLSFAENVIQWYRENGRDYPWRRIDDPYMILVTEILLLRTRADQVEKMWHDFFEKYPSPEELADAEEGEIREAISSLGLLWRAEKLKNLAEELVNNYDGEVPRDEEVFELPGVGEYVGNAYMCFLHGERRVFVDSNIVNILEELYDLEYSGEGRRSSEIKEKAEDLAPHEHVREYYFGLIDIGNELRSLDEKEREEFLSSLQ